MWLLDANVPTILVKTLNHLEIHADTTENRGWKTLENGKLVSAAATAGFKAILTRDREFALSAAKALKLFPQISIVILTLEQYREKLYIAKFLEAWKKTPIKLMPGKVSVWPG